MKNKPYIAKIVECYQTGNGNYFCREENDQEFDHHLDWKIFIPENVGKSILKYPFYGIISIEQNERFFNGQDRLTCRIVRNTLIELENILQQDEILEKEIQEQISRDTSEINGYYDRSNKCQLALKELKTANSIINWISMHQALYESVTIRPEGLPTIADSNFKGTTYKDIQLFVNLFELLRSVCL